MDHVSSPQAHLYNTIVGYLSTFRQFRPDQLIAQTDIY